MSAKGALPWAVALGALALGLLLVSRAQAQPPTLHPVAGREQCLLCHAPPGLGGAPAVPADHAGRPVSTCLACHQAAAASPTPTAPGPTATATATPVPGLATPSPTPGGTAGPVPTPTPFPATATPAPEQPAARDNAFCLSCHESPGLSFKLPSGETVGAAVDGDAFAASSHQRFQCTYCHQDKKDYPHSPLTFLDARAYRQERAGLCSDCHAEAKAQWQASVHGEAQAAGDLQAALCTDCHDAHEALPLTLPRAQTAPCSTCHEAVAESYGQSAHGKAIAEGRESATCASCHSSDSRAHTLRATEDAPGAGSPLVCGRCHAKALETFETTMHGRAWRLGTEGKAPTCVDCHGSYGVQPVHASESTLTAEAVSGTCAKCHTGADANFASGWLGHEEPSQRHFPWVYLTERFLFYLTTTVIAFGILITEFDLIRWWLNRRRRA